MTMSHILDGACAKQPPAPKRRRGISALLLALAAAALPLGAAQAQSGDWIEVRGGAWQVDMGTFVEMTSKLQRAVDAAPKPADTAKALVIDAYTLQYQGVKQGDTRLVHVLGACRVDSGVKLAIQWQVAAEPGVCYFEADYNPANKSFTKFSFQAPR